MRRQHDDRDIGGVQRGNLPRKAEQDACGYHLHDQGQQQTGGSCTTHVLAGIAAARKTHAHRGSQGDAQWNHEHHRGHVHGDLVTGDDIRTQLADGQGDGHEQAGFHQQGDGDGDADAEQLEEYAWRGAIEAGEQMQIPIALAASHVQRKGQALHPQNDGGGQTAAECAQLRKTECTVHQHIAEWPEQGEAEHAEIHGGPGQAHALAQSAQAKENGKRRRAPGNGAQESAGIRNEAGINANQAKQQGTEQGRGDAEPDSQRQGEPQGLAEQRRNLRIAARAVQLGNRRLQAHHHADDADDRQGPDIAAERHRTQGVRIEVTGQQGIDQIHANRRQLAKHQGSGEAQCVGKFVTQPATAGG